LSDDTNSEIVSGLQEGDTVVITNGAPKKSESNRNRMGGPGGGPPFGG